MTLAIDATDDATEIVAHKTGAEWTVNKNQGCMPMVGHSAETGQIVAVYFRTGNVLPAQDNLAFIYRKRLVETLRPKGRGIESFSD